MHKGIAFGFVPQGEYDFEVTFTEKERPDAVRLICTYHGHHFAWTLGGAYGVTCSIEHVIGRQAPAVTMSLVQGHQYTTLVKVRANFIEAYLDGIKLARLETNYTDLELPSIVDSMKAATLGLSFAGAQTSVKSATVTEIGEGEVPLPNAASASSNGGPRATLLASDAAPNGGSKGKTGPPATNAVAVTGTLYTTLHHDQGRGDNLIVYVNGARLGPMAATGPDGILSAPVTLRPGDILGFRVSSRFVNNRALRFAFLGDDKSVLFVSKLSSAAVRQQIDSQSPMVSAEPDGQITKVRRPGSQEWDGLNLPSEAEWIGLPQRNTLYDITTTVPALRAGAGTGVPAHSTATAVAPVPTAAKAGPTGQAAAPGRKIDLLRTLDLKRDVLGGTWISRGGTVEFDQTAGHGVIEFRYLPPAEYDYKVEFTEETRLDAAELLCAAQGHQFACVVGGRVNTSSGIGMINGRPPNVNVTSAPNSLLRNHRYTFLVTVRRAGVQMYLDGQELANLTTDFSNLSLPDVCKLRDPNTLGLLFWAGRATVDSATVTEVGGAAK